jgi:hypothetical protein
MKVVDGVIVAVGVGALVLAALVVVRSRDASRSGPEMTMPSIDAPAPPDSAFPACRAKPEGMSRWRCQVAQARKQQRIRCYGQRLYYVAHDATGKTVYHPWPKAFRCWNSDDMSKR